MPFAGENLISATERNASFDNQYEELKFDKNEQKTILFYGGISSLVGWKQHEYWASRFDKKPTPNDENIIFECIKLREGDNKVDCPGCDYDAEVDESYPKWRYGVPVMVEGNGEPMIFNFGPMIYNQLVNIYKTEFRDLGTPEEFAKYWFRIVRDDSTGRTEYKVGLTRQKIADDAELPEVINLIDFQFKPEVSDLVLKMNLNNLWNDKMEAKYNNIFKTEETTETVEETEEVTA